MLIIKQQYLDMSNTQRQWIRDIFVGLAIPIALALLFWIGRTTYNMSLHLATLEKAVNLKLEYNDKEHAEFTKDIEAIQISDKNQNERLTKLESEQRDGTNVVIKSLLNGNGS